MEKWNKLTNVVCLIIDGSGVQDFIDHREDSLSKLSNIFQFKLEFLSPSFHTGGSISQDLAIVSLSVNQKATLLKEFRNLENVIKHGEAFRSLRSIFPLKKEDPNENKNECKEEENEKGLLKLRLLLSCAQMIQEDYPLPIKGHMLKKYENYILTKDEYLEADVNSPMFSVDCEMCLTEIGKYELTRICVVDENLKVIYHSLVMPQNKITNYKTQFSGITKEILEGVTTSLEDVQKELRTLIPPNAILIGQSLNSDLNALKMMHPYVIDTSVIFNITGVRSRKTKLSMLAHLFMNKTIQKGGKLGHNPIEDSITAMQLVQLKLEKGYEYGDVILNGEIPDLIDLEGDSTSTKLRDEAKEIDLSTSVFKQVEKGLKDMKEEKNVSIIGPNDIIEQYKKYSTESTTLVGTTTSKEAIEKACDSAFNNHLTICHVKLPQDNESHSGESGNEEEKEESNKKWKYLKKWNKKLWTHTSKNGLFISVWNGASDQNAFVGLSLNKMKPDTT